MKTLNSQEIAFVSGANHQTRFGPFGAIVGAISGAGVYLYNTAVKHEHFNLGSFATTVAASTVAGAVASPVGAIWSANAAASTAILGSIFEHKN